MNLFLDIDIYIFSIVFLGIVCYNAYNKLDMNLKINCLFLLTATGILIGVISEMFTFVINGKALTWLITMNKLLNVVLFISLSGVTYLWYMFTKSWVYGDNSIKIELKDKLLVPYYLTIITTLLSPFTGFIFRITSENTYVRGPLYIIPTLTVYLYLMLSFILIIRNRNKVEKEDIFPLLLFGLLPTIGGLGQLLFYGIHLIWTSAAFSIIIVYIYIQQRMMQTESLTKAWTRSSFDQYLEKRLNKDVEDKFGIIYIDMDNFKQINDTNGHLEGDIALKTTVSLLKSVLSSEEILARYGGDEFIILTDKTSMDEIENLIDIINDKFNNYNKESDKSYQLCFSLGYDVYDPEKYTISQFINHVDMIMYKNKHKK